jgi:Tetracyclin repressor-like, C-terminal domain/Methylamine utilisation protein MauE
MSMLGLAARLTLAIVFAVAAIGKLRHLDAAREMLQSLGLPSTRLTAIGLSLGELLICAGLLTVPWAHPAALVATLMLTGFTVALLNARLRGRAPVCACFGGATPSPVTTLTLVRNLLLVGVGAVVTATAATRELDRWVLIGLAVAVLSAAGAAAIIMLIRRYGEALLRIRELEATLPALDGNERAAFRTAVGQTPNIELRSLHDGDAVTPSVSGRRELLVFLHPDCGHCHALLPEIRDWQMTATEPAGPVIRPVLVADSDTDTTPFETAGISELLLDSNGAASRAWGVTAFPAGVVIDHAGHVTDEPQFGAPAIRSLVAGSNDRRGAELITHVIGRQLPVLEPPDVGDARTELWRAVKQGLPHDGPAYVRLIGGLIAEQDHHPEMIDAFRRTVLLPRRATVAGIIQRGQARGEIRADIDPDAALELMAGPFLARVFAGLDTGPQWRKTAFETWWGILRERQPR